MWYRNCYNQPMNIGRPIRPVDDPRYAITAALRGTGLVQQELARRFGVKQSTVSLWLATLAWHEAHPGEPAPVGMALPSCDTLRQGRKNIAEHPHIAGMIAAYLIGG